MKKLEIKEIQKQIEEIVRQEKYKDHVMDQFWTVDGYNTILSISDYFDVYLKFLKKYFGENKRIPSRNQFYDHLTNELLESCSLDLKKRIKDLAIGFEKLQKNEIKIDLFDKIKKSFDIKLSAEEIIKKFPNLLEISTHTSSQDSDEQAEKVIRFRHHTIQEYLASQTLKKLKAEDTTWKEIFNKIGIFKTIKELNLKVINTSWTSTLRFLLDDLEVGNDVLEAIIKRIETNTEILDEETSTMLTLIERDISDKQKNRIFKLIYNEYQNGKKAWFPIWVATRLHKFITNLPDKLSEFKSILSCKQKNTWEDYAEKGNLILILDSILEENSIEILGDTEEQSDWKEILVQNSLYEYDNSVLQRRSIIALKYFQDASVIEDIKEAWYSKDELIVQNFIELVGEIGTEKPEYVKSHILEAIKGEYEIYGRRALYKVKSKESIKTVLEEFCKIDEHNKYTKPNLLHEFLDKESIFNSKKDFADKPLIENISKHFDDLTILNLAKDLIWKAIHIYRINVRHSIFLRELAKSIVSKDEGFLEELLVKISKQGRKESFNIAFNSWFVISGMLKPENAEWFLKKVEKLKIDDKNKNFTKSAIRSAARQNPDDWEKKIKELEKKKILPKRDQEQQESKKKERREKIKEFEKYVKEKRVRGFRFYAENKELLDEEAKESVEKLKKEVKELLEKYDTTKVAYKKLDDNRISATEFLSFYGDVLTAAKALDIDLNPYRKMMIHFIPFALTVDQELIIEALKEISDDELEEFNEILLDKNNDIRYSNPSSYIYVTSELKEKGSKIKSPVEVFLSFIEDKKIELYVKTYALEKIQSFDISEHKEQFKRIFEKYKDSKVYTKKMEVAELANEILIKNFKDKEAINWRFEQILKRREEPPKRQSGKGFTPTSFESELHTYKIASPLYSSLNLEKTFELFEVAGNWNEETPKYSWYLLRIVKASIEAKVQEDDTEFAKKFLKKIKNLSLVPEQKRIRDEVVKLVTLKSDK